MTSPILTLTLLLTSCMARVEDPCVPPEILQPPADASYYGGISSGGPDTIPLVATTLPEQTLWYAKLLNPHSPKDREGRLVKDRIQIVSSDASVPADDLADGLGLYGPYDEGIVIQARDSACGMSEPSNSRVIRLWYLE